MHSTRDDVVASVGRTMTGAAHRRDHSHATAGSTCHPHAVEVVHLGCRAVAVCHDCAADTGLLPDREAEQLALAHRLQTAVLDLPLQRRAAG